MRYWLALLGLVVASCGGSQAGVSGAKGSEEEPPAAGEAVAGPPVLEPPAGWKVAPQGQTTVASAPSSGAVIVLTTAPLAATKERIQEETNALAASVGIRLAGTSPMSGSAYRAMQIGPHKLSLWELPDAERDGEPGSLLVFAGKLTDTDLVVGIGFAVRGDLATSDAILAALATIEPAR